MYCNPLFFYFFSSIILMSGIMVITVQNSLYSVFFLISAFINATCLLILLEVDFIALTFLIVYVGAVAVLFLFVVMMINIREYKKTSHNFSIKLVITSIIGLIFLLEFFAIFFYDFPVNLGSRHPWLDLLISLPWYVGPYCWDLDIMLGREFVDFFEHIDVNSNIEALGQVLYTYYVSYFIMASFILLIAIIGAIILTMHSKEQIKRQHVYEQISRRWDHAFFKTKINFS